MRAILILCALLGGSSACQQSAVNIYGISGGRQSGFTDVDGTAYNTLDAQYGNDVTVFCSGTDSKNLNINFKAPSPDNIIPAKEVVNTTTIKVTTEKPKIYLFYSYTCVDEKTNCSATLMVSVLPVLTVVSPNVHHKKIENTDYYFLPTGEEYEVQCSGNKELAIYEGSYDKQAININGTTIISKQRGREKKSYLYYSCQYKPGLRTPRLTLFIDHPPAAKNFWCIQDDLQINCHWDVLSEYATFTMFYVDPDEKSMRIFEDHVVNKKNRSSEWSLFEIWYNGMTLEKNITFIMQSCNFVFCSNETYHINTNNITKSRTPVQLKVLNTTSQSTHVTWKELDIPLFLFFEYKVTYQLPGMPQQELNASSLQVKCWQKRDLSISTDVSGQVNVCEGELKLPCPGQLYEIKVFRRYKDTPRTNDAYWSEPATISVRTPQANSTEVVDPVCEVGPKIEELREELQSIERKLDFIRKVCQEKELEFCKILSSICIGKSNWAEFGSGWLYGSEWLRLFYHTLRHHDLGKFNQEEDSMKTEAKSEEYSDYSEVAKKIPKSIKNEKN